MMPAALDQALLAEMDSRWLKVARILGAAANKIDPDDDKLLEALAKRLIFLIADGRIEVRGDPSRWRHSEVRLSIEQ